MKDFVISSTFNLCHSTAENYPERVKQGLAFFAQHGIYASEFSTQSLDLLSDGWKGQVDAINDLSEQAGVRFTTAHLPFIKTGTARTDDFLTAHDARMHNAIDAARGMGVRYAIIHPDTVMTTMRDFDRREQFDATMQHLSPYIEHAQRIGLSVVIENMKYNHASRLMHRYCQTPDELCDVADALGIGVCWDFGHANISGIKQSEGLAYVGRRLKALHVNDNTGIDDDHTIPFMGTVNWKDAMHGLALAGYDEDVFNFELNAGRVPPALRGDYTDYLTRVARELISYIK